MVDNLRRRGFSADNLSVICSLSEEEKSFKHLFLQCEVSRFLWYGFFRNAVFLRELVVAWRFDPFYGCGLILWRIIPFAILWSI